MYHNRISEFLDESPAEYPTAGSISETPSSQAQGPCLTTISDIYEVARKRAVLDCQIDELFNADDLLDE